VRLAGQDVPFPLDKVVATDASGRDEWTIVRLDWNYPPFLVPVGTSGSGSPAGAIRGDVVHDRGGLVVRPGYDAVQQQGIPQQPAILRLFVVGGKTCLMGTTEDPSGFVVPETFSNLVSLSVTPRTADAVGQEVFSQPFYVGIATYLLPNVRNGGYQPIRASSIQEAEQLAVAAGTWDPSAAGGLTFFTLPDIVSGNAQQVLAHSLDEAEQVAEGAGTWNQKAGTYGVTSVGAALSRGVQACQA
jgi:hypothetical protein